MYELCADQSKSTGGEPTSSDIYPFFAVRAFNSLTSMCSGMLYVVMTYAHFPRSPLSQAASNYYHPALSDNELEVQKSESSFPRFPACPSIGSKDTLHFPFCLF